ncbi:MAG TPA: glyoxalase superfamily protein [Vicinamibacterales bacterium]|nr:glyoxalase superfamily protein [Vicinamibacterales bacterium]
MKFTTVTPNLITNDIARAQAFYCDVLGFTVTMSVPPDREPKVFVMLERDGINIFLNDFDDARTTSPEVVDGAPSFVVGKSGVGIFIVITEIAAYWEQVRHRARVVAPLKDQWYGMTEFTVTDPDGYLITFAERRSQ